MTRVTVLLLVVAVMGALILEESKSLADNDTCLTGNPVTNDPQNRPSGLLIRNPSGGATYRVEGCYKRLFRMPQDLSSHRYAGWIKETNVSQEELSRLPDNVIAGAREATFFRLTTGQIYVIDETSPGQFQKRYLTAQGAASYFNCGANPPQFDVDLSFLNTYYPTTGAPVDPLTKRPDGQLVKHPNNPTVYVLESGQRRPVATPDDLTSHNFLQTVCVDSAITSALYPLGPALRARQGTVFSVAGNIHVIDQQGPSSYSKRQFTSPDSLGFFDLQAPVSWNPPQANGYVPGFHVHPMKTLFVDRWYKPLTTSSLTMDRSYFSGIPPSDWDGAITAARNAWDATPTTLSITDFGQNYNPTRDIHVSADYQAWAAGAMTLFYGTLGGGSCGDPPDCAGTTFRQVDVFLNQSTTAPSFRQALVAHELGHVVALAHDGMDPDSNGDGVPERDFQCGFSPVPPPVRIHATLEDNDCTLQSPFLVGPVNWDTCGVNHAYPSSSGASGC